MFKGLKFLLVLFVLLGFVMSCGSSSTIEQVCKAGVAKMYDECDVNDANDVISIMEAFESIGIAVSAQEIATISEPDVRTECVDALELAEVDITKEEVQLFELGLSQLTPGCDEIMGYLANFGD